MSDFSTHLNKISPSAVAFARQCQELFSVLRERGYAWRPVRPERLLKLRQQPATFDPLTRYFGLGLEVDNGELEGEGLSHALLESIRPLRPAVSRIGDRFLIHDHWPPSPEHKGSFVYVGEESFELADLLEKHRDRFAGKNVLDLGSGAGVLSFAVADGCRKAIGLESSPKAAEWSKAAATAQGLAHLDFRLAPVGTPASEEAVKGERWDLMVSNPPMTIPVEGDPRPHRDGGAFGLELPFLFLDFAQRHLVAGGEVFMLCTNPIVGGKALFFDRLKRLPFEILEKHCLDDHFNHSLYRKEGYGALGIERIELYALWFQRNL